MSYEHDISAPVAAITEEASVSLEGPSKDRVRLSVGAQGGGEEFYLVLDALAAKELGFKLVATSMKAMGYPHRVAIMVGNADIIEPEDEPEQEPEEEGEVIFPKSNPEDA